MSDSKFAFAVQQVLSLRSLLFLRSAAALQFPGFPRPHFFFLARNALYHCLRALEFRPGDQVLVPSFICSAAVDPLFNFGADVVFCQNRPDCAMDLNDLEAKVTARTRAVLAVHYFGFPESINAIRRICDDKGLALIEDCAHVLLGQHAGRHLGSFGDASVYSLRKFFPVYDGACLILNRTLKELAIQRSNEPFLFTLKVAKTLFDQVAQQGDHPLLSILSRWLDALKGPLIGMREMGERDSPLWAESTGSCFNPSLLNHPISRLSRLIHEHSDVKGILTRRRENYCLLASQLRQIGGVRMLFPDLPDFVCPLVCPVFFENGPRSHLALRMRGIPATTWGGVRPSSVMAKEFPCADFLYDNLVFLPIHQDLQERHLDMMLEAVKSLRGSDSHRIPPHFSLANRK
jgi:dTDP-4-amino-4,6-dideoxygalactose transaminase